MPPPKGLATLFNPLLSSLGNSTSRVGLSSGRIELIGIHQQQQQQHFQTLSNRVYSTSTIDIVRLKQGRHNEATTRRRDFSSSTSIHVSLPGIEVMWRLSFDTDYNSLCGHSDPRYSPPPRPLFDSLTLRRRRIVHLFRNYVFEFVPFLLLPRLLLPRLLLLLLSPRLRLLQQEVKSKKNKMKKEIYLD
jgi:hypothetical protein